MANLLLLISLIAIPLAIPLSLPFLPSIPDLWQTKDFLAIIFTLGIILKSNSAGNIGQNPWLTALMIFLPISIFSAPPIKLMFGHENIGGLWMWKDFAWCLLYFCLYSTLRGMKINENKVGKAIGWTAVISSIYAILQAFGLDQWQATRIHEEIGSPRMAWVTANIGNPTYLGVWLGMCLPFAIVYLRLFWGLLIFVTIIICQSHFGTCGTIITMILMFCLFKRRSEWILGFLIACFIAFSLMIVFWHQVRPHINDNGRFPIWKETLKDWKKPCILIPTNPDMSKTEIREIEFLNKRNNAFTGRGIGSYNTIFATKHETKFNYTHNEYLQALYEIGIIGLFLIIMALGHYFWEYVNYPLTKFRIACLCSGFFSCICAFGLPVWHIEPLRFYSVVIMSLI